MASTIAIYGIAFMSVVLIGMFNLFDSKVGQEPPRDQKSDSKLG
jgi:hypothetical protein